ncbi:ABC transporter ATP-binding protein [Buchananella hordeovulneris]|uniref:Multidrug ABC transporter ATP-binding protein n=1 Tax=Buchananella hordeovulneris TaxID=52770 RepID=A0A1Q5PWW6_9ACTO|nr:ABC transporter ATP-binding protein [Buchananella hordeovulneris]MDO5080131.1 ABC transporter ATP-binding protein [Buchananella hordeovulneris]OKL52114.1 multidrug ABC transporter ATP-binding protein [Buchananella hordeovulneris]
MYTIEAENVSRVYGKGAAAFVAVDGVSLQVAKGELVALLGTNGAGKTSLVEVLQGSAPAAAGQVKLFGQDPIRDRQAIRPRSGIMLQEAGFAQELTVGETLRMWAGTLSQPRPVAEALELTELSHRTHVRIKSLSGGEKRRLDLALATLGRPELLFLDEPTTGLDPASRRRTWELIRGMLSRGATILLTTHYLEEAEELADRVLIMAGGKIRTEGTVSQIVASQPATIQFADTALPDDVLAALPARTGHIVHERGHTKLRSVDLHTTLRALLAAADAQGLHLDQLDARAASLEQAFLQLSANIAEHDASPAAPPSSANPARRQSAPAR